MSMQNYDKQRSSTYPKSKIFVIMDTVSKSRSYDKSKNSDTALCGMSVPFFWTLLIRRLLDRLDLINHAMQYSGGQSKPSKYYTYRPMWAFLRQTKFIFGISSLCDDLWEAFGLGHAENFWLHPYFRYTHTQVHANTLRFDTRWAWWDGWMNFRILDDGPQIVMVWNAH